MNLEFSIFRLFNFSNFLILLVVYLHQAEKSELSLGNWWTSALYGGWHYNDKSVADLI